MASVVFDPDIASTQDPFTLDKIRTQELRNAYASQAAHREVIRGQLETLIEWAIQEYQKLPVPAADDVKFRWELAAALAGKYFTPSTGTLPDTIRADAVNDANRFAAGLDELLKRIQ